MTLATAETTCGLGGGWRESAACRGRSLDLWYSSGDLEQRVARAVCRHCPVRSACLAEAMVEEDGDGPRFGVRGGMTAGERDRLVRRSA